MKRLHQQRRANFGLWQISLSALARVARHTRSQTLGMAWVKDGAGVECGNPKTVLFVMLNPSTADGGTDDATIRRCVESPKRGSTSAWKSSIFMLIERLSLRICLPPGKKNTDLPIRR